MHIPLLNRRQKFAPIISTNKYEAEAEFWRDELQRYVAWYNARGPHYSIASPRPEQREKSFTTPEKNATATWTKLYQQPRYLDDLGVPADFFRNQRILDIGCGPVPSALAFTEAEVYGLDHLVDIYRQLGFPIDEYNDGRFHFIQAKSEAIPFESRFFDAVISANAIDHVDDLQKTADEIRRVLKPQGKFRMHVHYHPPTTTEPLTLDDRIFTGFFGWIPNLKKISSSTTKDLGHTTAAPGESYHLWAN